MFMLIFRLCEMNSEACRDPIFDVP